jgi:hypothetical protein
MTPEPLGGEAIRVDNSTTAPRVGLASLGLILVLAFVAMVSLVIAPILLATGIVYVTVQTRKINQITLQIAHWR